MSNESNRPDSRTISPSDLQACDFFPPGHGWNKQDAAQQEAKADEKTAERESFDDIAIDANRPH